MSWVVAELPGGRRAIMNPSDVTQGIMSETPYVFNELLFDFLSLLSDEELLKYNVSTLDRCLDCRFPDKVLVQLERRYRIVKFDGCDLRISDLKAIIKRQYPDVLIDFIGNQAHVHGKVDVDSCLGDGILVGLIGTKELLDDVERELGCIRVDSGFRFLFGDDFTQVKSFISA
jgi:hypothetical protein